MRSARAGTETRAKRGAGEQLRTLLRSDARTGLRSACEDDALHGELRNRVGVLLPSLLPVSPALNARAPLHRRRAVGRREVLTSERGARRRSRARAVRLVHHAAAAPGRSEWPGVPLRRSRVLPAHA